jgi:diguanylate cyclase (GGDEF)-like protein
MSDPERPAAVSFEGDALTQLLALGAYVSRRRELDDLLSECVTRAAHLIGSQRASLQVLDPDKKQLIARCRAGEPVHSDPEPFALGEGLAGWVALHGLPIRAGDAEKDPRFVQRPSRRRRMGSFLGVPLLAGGSCIGVLSFSQDAHDRFDVWHQALAELVAAIVSPHVELARLARLTKVDPLTGLLNRRGLDAHRDAPRPAIASVVAVDLDHFKSVNDSFGHATGDRVLVMVADVLAGIVRRGDWVARTGGEEFVMVLPGAPLAAAVRIAERARARIAATPVLAGGGQSAVGEVRVTSSFGVAELAPGETIEAATARADAALYEAKRLGRDRVVEATPASDGPPPMR